MVHSIRKMGSKNDQLPTAADLDPGSDEDEAGDGEAGKAFAKST
jgi:hypothetical protein